MSIVVYTFSGRKGRHEAEFVLYKQSSLVYLVWSALPRPEANMKERKTIERSILENQSVDKKEQKPQAQEPKSSTCKELKRSISSKTPLLHKPSQHKKKN
jgi:hypothetical protein